MDKYFLVCIALSMAAHGVVMIHLPSLYTSSRTSAGEAAIEFNYIEMISPREAAAPAIHLQRSEEAVEEEESETGESGIRETTPEILRGTGEMLRASVRELLKPLDVPRERNSGELAAGILRYKKRIERILAKNSAIAYPLEARQNRREARYTIRFSVKSDGSLEKVELPANSGAFGLEIVEGLEKASVRFPAFPPELTVKKLTFSWPVSFTLY